VFITILINGGSSTKQHIGPIIKYMTKKIEKGEALKKIVLL